MSVPLSHVSWPYRELDLRPQWGWPHASVTPSTAPRGPIGSSTQGPSVGGHMRPPRPAQRSVALQEAPPKASVGCPHASTTP
eukprot:44244-Pyramimonas_sp.AAC.1